MLLAASAGAVTRYAATLARDDVNAVVLLSADGDSIILPPGTVTYTNHIAVSNAISIVATGAPASTWIGDGIPNGVNAFNQNVFYFCCQSNKTSRLSGVWFGDSTNRSTKYDHGTVMVQGFGKMALDNCRFQGCQNNYVYIDDQVGGVAHHNTFVITAHQHCFSFNGSQYGGTNYQNGDGSWYLPANYGSPDLFYVEDSFFTNSFSINAAFIDCFQGARFVFRNNQCFGDFLSYHGTESGQRQRAPRQSEVYANTFRLDPWKTATIHGINARGGTSLFFSNTFAGYRDAITLSLYRVHHSFPSHWGGANGINNWDSNSPTLFYAGQHTGSNNSFADSRTNVPLMIASGVSWTPNQWAGYILLDTNSVISQNSSTSSSFPNYHFGYIYSNSASALFCANDGTGIGGAAADGTLHFTNSAYYQIRQVLQILDACGAGSGDLLTGNSGESPRWLNQPRDIVYGWSNLWSDTGLPALVSAIQNLQLVEGRDFTNGIPKPGYTPYTYPHPLQGAGPPPFPPSIISQPTDIATPPGQPATFSVVAIGGQPITYQWHRNGAPIAGATTSTYTRLNVTEAMNGELYRVGVTNSAGGLESVSATLFIRTASVAGNLLFQGNCVASASMRGQ
jgi:hypothetical protein